MKLWLEYLNVRDRFKELDVDRIILKWILRRKCGRSWTGFAWRGQGPVKAVVNTVMIMWVA
jgi:hypothetical protein